MGDSIYAATNIGLFKANINDNLLDYQSWQHLIVDFPITQIVVAHQKIYFLGTSLENIYCYSSQNMFVAATTKNLKFLKEESDRLFVGAQSNLIEIMPDNTTNTIIENSYLYKVSDVIVDGNIYWCFFNLNNTRQNYCVTWRRICSMEQQQHLPRFSLVRRLQLVQHTLH